MYSVSGGPTWIRTYDHLDSRHETRDISFPREEMADKKFMQKAKDLNKYEQNKDNNFKHRYQMIFTEPQNKVITFMGLYNITNTTAM